MRSYLPEEQLRKTPLSKLICYCPYYHRRKISLCRLYAVEFHRDKAVLVFIYVEDYLCKAVDVARREDKAVLVVSYDVGIVVPVACNNRQTSSERVYNRASQALTWLMYTV